MEFWAIVLAAGLSTRFSSFVEGMPPKQFLAYKNNPLYLESIKTLSAIPNISGITVVFPEKQHMVESKRLASLSLTLPLRTCIGGTSRLESMILGLKTISSKEKYVLIHDAARPFFTPKLIQQLCLALTEKKDAHGVVPSLPLSDTIKKISDNTVINTPQRSLYQRIQTPQLFIKESLEQSVNLFLQSLFPAEEITDDSMLLERAGFTVIVLPGEEKNKKITYKEDFVMLEKKEENSVFSKTIMGYDVHAYTQEEGGRDFILGGVPIDTPYKLKAHSDGDVLLHAIIDALLAIIGEGDIGQIFPDTEKQYEGISSAVLLSETMRKLEKISIQLLHVDVTIVAQKPIISPYTKKIQENLAYLLEVPTKNISIKATTEEHLGFTGENRGIKAYSLITFV